MAGRRARRRRSQTLLPLSSTRLSHSISCWYCDFKISVFNEPLFFFGRRNTRFLRIWFTVGVGFSLTALVGATLILLQELAGALHIWNGASALRNLSTRTLFGLSPQIPGLGVSIMDFGYWIFSTVISVAIHEFGHAIAAASEGVHIEYVAIFLAIIFPGALVAFNYEMLQSLPHTAELRVYCAGIWHNAMSCAVCGGTLFLLPLILYPFYALIRSPMVVSVEPRSALSGYLSPGDLVLSLDGAPIHDRQEWMEKMLLMGMQDSSRKGYCVPNIWIAEGWNVQPLDQFSCPDELTAFAGGPCLNSSLFEGDVFMESQIQNTHCLAAKEVAKFQKCGNGWPTLATNISTCPCLKDESCLAPVQQPGVTWVEVTYSSSYSSHCAQFGGNLSDNSFDIEFGGTSCINSFIFVGNVLAEAYAVQLTSYQPRWAFSFGVSLPNMLEKILLYTFHVSATLALLNSLPVYFLDGESILQVALCYITWLSPRRKLVLRICLLVGSLLSILAMIHVFLTILMP
ncbi:membrane-bound transcription factor site-2 protease homolog [Aristolochia californica]|uniref:membrane-bound transcription factor site-2 protease homolog n=1 Tax=Aristolochia californica TaxID=171875 RepID=UPI0035D9DBE1